MLIRCLVVIINYLMSGENVMQSDEKRKAYVNERRWRSRNLGIAFADFKSGAGDINRLWFFLRMPDLALSNKLEAIDIALERGIISDIDLNNKQDEPKPEFFGAKSAKRPALFDKTKIKPLDYYQEKIVLLLLFIWITLFHYTFFKFEISFLSVFSSFLLGSMSGALAGGVLAGLIGAIEECLPGAAAYRRYTKAVERYQIIAKAQAVKALEADVRIYENASGREFERLVARAMRRSGWAVEEMGGANDGGIDLVCSKGSLQAIVQCKAHAKKISPAVVRELYGTLSNHRASIAILASTKGATDNARIWAKGKPIRFISIDDLVHGRL